MSQFCDHKNNYTWWESDANNIPFIRVCEACRDIKMSAYKGDVPTSPQYKKFLDKEKQS